MLEPLIKGVQLCISFQIDGHHNYATNSGFYDYTIQMLPYKKKTSLVAHVEKYGDNYAACVGQVGWKHLNSIKLI